MKFLPSEKQFELIQRGAEEIIPKDELIKNTNNMIYDQIKKAGLIILMFDANVGITSDDIKISNFL